MERGVVSIHSLLPRRAAAMGKASIGNRVAETPISGFAPLRNRGRAPSL